MTVLSRLARVQVLALTLAPVWMIHGAHGAALTLREVVALTTESNPQLVTFVQQSGAVRQQGLARSFAPPLSIEAELANFGGSGDVSAAQALETTLQLSKVFELGDKARRRGDLAAAQLDDV